MMISVSLRKRYHAAHDGLSFRPFLGCFVEKMFKAGGSSIDEYMNRLIGFI